MVVVGFVLRLAAKTIYNNPILDQMAHVMSSYILKKDLIGHHEWVTMGYP